MSYTHLLSILINVGEIVPKDIEPSKYPFHSKHDPNVVCGYHAGHVGHSIKDCHILKNKVQEFVNQKLICFTPANTIKDKFEYKRPPLQVPVFASIVHPATQYQGL